MTTSITQTLQPSEVPQHVLHVRVTRSLTERVHLVIQELEKQIGPLEDWKKLYLPVLEKPESEVRNEILGNGLSDLRTEVVLPLLEDLATGHPLRPDLDRLDTELKALLRQMGCDVEALTLENRSLNEELAQIRLDQFEALSAKLEAKENEEMERLAKKFEEIKGLLQEIMQVRTNQTEMAYQNTKKLIANAEAFLAKMRDRLTHMKQTSQQFQAQQVQLRKNCEDLARLLKDLQ